MSAVELTEKLLMDAGGWQTMKHARSLAEGGAVLEANYEAPWLRGRVREGGREYRAGLKIVDKLHIDNLCTCRTARDFGSVCAHALAVGLAIVRPVKKETPRGTSETTHISQRTETRPVTTSSYASSVEPREQGLPVFTLNLEGSLNQLSACLKARYGEAEFLAGENMGNAESFPDPRNPGRRCARNRTLEEQAVQRLRRAGFVGPDRSGELVLKREPFILRFFAEDLPALQRDWTVTIGARFENITREIDRIHPRLEIQRSGEDWFDLTVHLETGEGQRFSAAEIQRLMHGGQSHVRMKSGRLAVFSSGLLDELENVLRDCAPQQRQPGTYRVNQIHAGYIDAALGEGAKIDGPPAWRTWSRAQRQLEKPQPVPLGSLEGVLRPYQKDGVFWMHFLARHGLGGILADEMGLGKTLQALALLRLLRGPSLIVCPSSLVYNWEREAARFTPERKLLVIAGSERQGLFGSLPDHDLVVTSYPLLRRDIAHYRAHQFAAVVLDEAQHIKNPETQNAQAAAELRANARFVLTGTPVENSVRDLWSLTEFLMPGYLGSRTDFRERYERRINQNPEAPEKRRLASRIRPFLLRRLKISVLPELPEKLEQVTYCELDNDQRSLYNSVLQLARAQLEDATGGQGAQNSMAVLTTLLRLRQICCDARLLGSQVAGKESSAKLDLLLELVREAMDGGHKILVFSQFVAMLRLIRDRLQAEETGFCYLDGATKDRGREIDRFQTSDVPVFLISLKAGGVGLNLTAADTVIHYDPWWNPAVEAQATDRAHRIGQKRVVTSYKLITRDTVEEKILNLQRRKRAVIDATIESEQPLMSGLSLSEIGDLLS